jgi:hypothetical protein
MAHFDDQFNLMNQQQTFPADAQRGHMISKTYSSNMHRDENGRWVGEKYYQDSVQRKEPDTGVIGHSRQKYVDTEKGIKKVAQEKMLGDKVAKIVREEHPGEEHPQTHTYFHNLEEQEAKKFD